MNLHIPCERGKGRTRFCRKAGAEAAPAAMAASMEALLDELLEGVTREDLCKQITRFPDWQENTNGRSQDEEDERQDHIEAEVAQAA